MASVTSNPSATGPLANRPPGSLTLRIEPPSTWFELRLQELWKYRELLFFLVWRDVKVRYKQTAIGIAWVIVQPLLTMLVAVVVLEALWQYLEYFRAARATGRSGILPLFSRQLLFGVVVCVCLLPTFVSRWIVYGGPFETGYLPIRDFLWNSPVFLKVLLSANHGLLSWTPVLIFSLLGLVLLARRLPRLGAPFFAATFAFYLFISIYPDWAGISSLTGQEIGRAHV